jgi:hypothetical protein
MFTFLVFREIFKKGGNAGKMFAGVRNGQVFSSFIDSLTCSRCVMVGSLVLGNPEHKRKRSMENQVAHKNI